MTAKEKLNEERDEIKLARMNRILENAFLLFSEKGIDTIAMTDIAKKAEIGVASLYRYYDTKDEIAIRTAIWAWEKQKRKILPEISTDDFSGLNGISQIEKIISLFIELFELENAFFRFIYFFDSYAVRTGITADRLTDYENIIESVHQIVKKSLDKGFEDKSINVKFENRCNELYFTLMHTIFSVTQKLCLSGNMLNMDRIISGKKELETLKETIIGGLK